MLNRAEILNLTKRIECVEAFFPENKLRDSGDKTNYMASMISQESLMIQAKMQEFV